MLHYCPRHVSSINIPIFKRKNCIHTASGIVSLCKRLHSTPVESGKPPHILQWPTTLFWQWGSTPAHLRQQLSFSDVFQALETMRHSSKRVSEVIFFLPFRCQNAFSLLQQINVRKDTFPFIPISVIDRFQCIMSHARNITSRFQ